MTSTPATARRSATSSPPGPIPTTITSARSIIPAPPVGPWSDAGHRLGGPPYAEWPVGRDGNSVTPGGVLTRMAIRATWKGAVLAESDRTVVVEGNHYFPP